MKTNPERLDTMYLVLITLSFYMETYKIALPEDSSALIFVQNIIITDNSNVNNE